MMTSPPPYSEFSASNETSSDPAIPTERSHLVSAPTVHYNTTILMAERSTPIVVNFPKNFWNNMIMFIIMLPSLIFPIMFLTSSCQSYVRDLRRHQAGVTWSPPMEELCVKYGSRGYSARLLNYEIDRYWNEACELTKMVIRGQKMKEPLACEVVGNEVIGHWKTDDDDIGCKPFWGPVEEEYCVGSDKIITIQQMHIRNDTQWEAVCTTTPFHSAGKTYFPISCENKGPNGIFAHIQIRKDEGCLKQERIRHLRETGVGWSIPQPGACSQYAVRKYSATLLRYNYDNYWMEACENTELFLEGQNVTSPDQCQLIQNQDGQPTVVGHWDVMNYFPECTPYWGSISNDHCVGTNKRMVSARLWNIRDSNLWDRMCNTAPLTLQNVSRVPLSCENKGIWGIWGHWEISDDTCAMFSE